MHKTADLSHRKAGRVTDMVEVRRIELRSKANP